MTESAAQTLRGNTSLVAPVADARVAELTTVLQNYMQRHRDPIDVHTGIFAPHIVVIPEVIHRPVRIHALQPPNVCLALPGACAAVCASRQQPCVCMHELNTPP